MPSWFDGEVAALEQRTHGLRGSPSPVLFYGSSSFTLWHDVESYFPGVNIVNHGFGGSTLADCVEYFPRLVTPIRPSAVVLYAGDNDLGDGHSPERVLGLLQAFIRLKREAFGALPMAYVSIKISPARFGLMHAIAYTNTQAERLIQGETDVRFINITRRMVSRGLVQFGAYYTHDELHMNREGYRVLGKSLAEYLAEIEPVTGNLRVRPSSAQPAWLLPDEECTDAAA